MAGQFEKYSLATVQTFDTQYDYASILHYDSSAFSRNGQPTILPLNQYVKIGQRGGFSTTDAYKINRLYECPTDASTTQTAITTSTVTPQTTAISFRKLPTVEPGKCVNKRPDCDQLLKEGMLFFKFVNYKLKILGWCSKNEEYMNKHCCDICKNVKPTKAEDCEDLRVDCLALVKKRYCIVSPQFSKQFCSKSCGFCPPSDKDLVDRTDSPTVVTLAPSTVTTTTILSTTMKELLCRDKSFKCVTWKKYGYCTNPMYSNYMKNTCPFSCKYCTVYTQP
jgi:astacin